VTFNLVTNLLLVPTNGYQAAALTTIASELMLLIPFALLLRGTLGDIPWVKMLWRPVTATGGMIGIMGLLWAIQPLIALLAGTGTYLLILLLLRPLDTAELARLEPLLPARLRRS
jgi:O-antigen/teichoic acid export membrane protein